MRKLMGLILLGIIGTSCVTTTKIYRSPLYNMNKKEPVYIEKSDNSLIYSDAQLQNEGDMLRAVPDKKIDRIIPIDSLLFKKLKSLRYKPELVDKSWRSTGKGVLITYKDYWINESDPTFYRFWMKGIMMGDSSNVMVYEGAPIPSTSAKPDPTKEINVAIAELTIPGAEIAVDESDIYTVEDEMLLPKTKFYGAINVGYGKRFGNSYSDILPSDKTHREKLQKGVTFGADLGYYFKPNFGAGVSFSSFRTKRMRDLINTENGYSAISQKDISDQVGITYVGPAAYIRNLYFQGRLSTVLSVSGGLLKYNNAQEIYKEDTSSGESITMVMDNKMSASGLGGKVGAGIDYIFHKNAGIGVNFGMLLGKLSVKDQTLSTEEQTVKISMNHFNIGVGLRIFL